MSPRPQPTLPVEGFTFRRDGTLVVTTEKRHRALFRKGLSVSAAQNIAKCPASWAGGYAVPEVRDLFKPNELGTGAHSVLEHLYQLDPSDRTRDAAREIAGPVTEHTWAEYAEQAGIERDPVTEQRWREQVVTLAEGDFELENPAAVQVHRTEMSFRGLLLPNGVPFNGDIDRVDLAPGAEPGTKFEVVDYKTGKYSPHNPKFGDRDQKADQIRIYAEAVATGLGVPRPERGRLLFTGAKVEQAVDVSDSEIDIALGWFAAQWEDVNTFRDQGEFPARPGNLCGWCPLANACPVAKVKTDKAKRQASTAHSALQLGIRVDDAVVPFTAADRKPKLAEGAGPDAPRIGEPTPTPTSTETVPMTTNQTPAVRPEGGPQHELVSTADGQMVLNLNSYASTRLFGLAALAYQHVKQQAAGADGATIANFAHLLADILKRAEANLTGQGSWQSGANTRLSGLLRECIEQVPAPFGGSRDDWARWHYETGSRMHFLAKTAIDLHDNQQATPTSYLDALASSPANVEAANETVSPFANTHQTAQR